MLKRILGWMLAVAVLLLLSIALSFIFYNALSDQTMNELRIQAELCAQLVDTENGDKLLRGYFDGSQIRCTIIDSEGWVIYDSQADTSVMENHSNREEFIEAQRNGKGESSRISDTTGIKSRYVAYRIANGNEIRLSESNKTLFRIFSSILPSILAAVSIAAVIWMFIYRYITKHIMDTTKKVTSEYIRKEFTANVSHELKTPLTSISGYAEMISSGIADSDDYPRFAAKIKDEAARLILIIDDILVLSNLDETGDRIEMQQVDFSQTASQVVEALKGKAAENDVIIKVSDGDVMGEGNPNMIYNMIYNLVDNAIKYNKKGGTVTISISGGADKGVSISVKDTGIGIPKEHQERIFERFYRIDKSRSKKTGGTGLGLSIVKHIAQVHNGSIKVISKVGAGTEVIVRI